MKKPLTILLFVSCTGSAFAQRIWDREFKPFKIDASAGYAMPRASGEKGGLLFAMEPKYAFVGDQVSFGLRLEAAILTPPEDSSDISTQQSQANVSVILTSDYYFNNNDFRPLVGGGFGWYSMMNQTGKEEGALLPDTNFSNRFGCMIRGGFEWGHLRTGIEYNFVTNNASYLGFKLGIILGGGRMGLISAN